MEIDGKNHILDPKTLTSARLLTGNVIWNFAGSFAPVIIAVICLPLLKRGLGTERLGIISLAFVVVGYFSLFDFGLSRALTKMVAERVGHKSSHEIPGLVWTSLVLMTVFGLLGAVLGFELSPWYVHRAIRISLALQRETLLSFYWLSASLPVVVITAGLRGVLEALQEFRIVTAIRIPLGILTYLAPVAVLPFSHSVATTVAVLIVIRALGCIAHIYACLRVLPELRKFRLSPRSSLFSLLSFGSWMTISNAISPLMLWFDRFVIASLISVSAAAYYAIPNEVVIRLTIIPYAVLSVLFPAFSTANTHDPQRVDMLWQATLRYIFVAQFPIILLLIAFAPEGLRLWLGADFAQNSTLVVRWLLAAILMNSVAQVPYAHLQSIGRPDITAKLQICELFMYAGVLYFFTRRFGINGVAVTWFLRMTFEAAALFYFSSRFLPRSRPAVIRLGWMAGAAMGIFVLASATMPLEIKAPLVAALCLAGTLTVWYRMFSGRERELLAALAQSVLRSGRKHEVYS